MNRTYYELYEYKNETTYNLLQDIKKQNKIEFKVISDKQYHIALKEFMKYGKFIDRFPVKYIYEWKDLISDNIIKLGVLTEICGHSVDFPFDCFEDVFDYDGKFTDWKQKKYEETDEEDYLKKYKFYVCYEYMNEVFNLDDLLPKFSNGQDTISDYGLEPLEKLMKEMSEQDTPEEIIVTLNKIMDVSHQRGDLAELFIEGGSKTLSYISNE